MKSIFRGIRFRWSSVCFPGLVLELRAGVWGGLRGALALRLNSSFPYREEILKLMFGVVIFSILAQGLTMRPLLPEFSLFQRSRSFNLFHRSIKCGSNGGHNIS
jgi:NhaP-type Na+/H+ or K+/H+ antiporter